MIGSVVSSLRGARPVSIRSRRCDMNNCADRGNNVSEVGLCNVTGLPPRFLASISIERNDKSG